MSISHLPTLLRRFALAITATAWGLALCPDTNGQLVSLSLRILPGAQPRVLVQGTNRPINVWSFRDSYAGIVGLGQRVSNLRVTDGNGSEIAVRQIAPGHFEAAAAASKFSYEVNLALPNGSDAAMISWLNDERGVLMLRDLLPTFATTRHAGVATTLSLNLPSGWRAYSDDKPILPGEFGVSDYDRIVIAVGKTVRESKQKISDITLTLFIDGQWAFSDDELTDLAAKVLKAHLQTFNVKGSGRVTLILFPFPREVGGNRWAAETRGTTVTLLFGKVPSKVAALAQLSTPLTHEFFHLWVPNGLALDGDYDWFYEGFTVYQAARTALKLDLLTFAEFLDAVARAYDGSKSAADLKRLSLIDASHRRWTAGATTVYSKAFVIAFLYDLKLRHESRGKQSLESVYRKLFEQYRSMSTSSNAGDGNRAAIDALASAVSADFVRTFVTEPVEIDLEKELVPYGVRVDQTGVRTRLSVAETLTRQQRDLLRDLGYNDGARRAK